MDKQGDGWNNYGALDEENTESAHAKMNNVSRLFGASRGPNRKKMTINKLLLTSNSILTQGIYEKEQNQSVSPLKRANVDEKGK